MVFHAANDQSLHLVLPRNAAEVGPETLLEVRLDERATFVCGPNAMHQTTGKGVHGGFLSSLRDSFGLVAVNPAMNRWAIVFRPLGCRKATSSWGRLWQEAQSFWTMSDITG